MYHTYTIGIRLTSFTIFSETEEIKSSGEKLMCVINFRQTISF